MKGKGGTVQHPSQKVRMKISPTIGIRERRRVYEDAIAIIGQAQKMQQKVPANLARVCASTTNQQLARCASIIETSLGYHETMVENKDGTRTAMLYPEDNNADYAITKEKFDLLIQQLPNNKDLKESMWKHMIKREAKATAKFHGLTA